MKNKFKQLVSVAVLGGVLLASYPTKAFDEDKCTPEVGTAFTAQNGERFCASKILMQNWFTAFSWCKAIGGHLATLDEACNGQLSSCNNIKGSGRNSWVWTATPKADRYAFHANLSTGELATNAYATFNRAQNQLYALCK